MLEYLPDKYDVGHRDFRNGQINRRKFYVLCLINVFVFFDDIFRNVCCLVVFKNFAKRYTNTEIPTSKIQTWF